jgi:hypothetical protein
MQSKKSDRGIAGSEDRIAMLPPNARNDTVPFFKSALWIMVREAQTRKIQKATSPEYCWACPP